MQHSKRQRRDYTNPYMVSNLMPVLVSILKSHAGLIAFPFIVSSTRREIIQRNETDSGMLFSLQ